MTTMARATARPAFIVVGLMYLIGLSVALVWLHLSPDLVLGLSVGFVVLVALTVRPMLGIHAMILLLFVENVARTEGGITVAKLIAPVVLLGWLMSLAIERKPPFRRSAFVGTMFLFVGWCSLSLLYALDFDVALYRLLTFLQLAVATLMFASVVDTRERMRKVLWGTVTCGAFITLASLTMYALELTARVQGFRGDRNGVAVNLDMTIVCAYALYHITQRPGVRLFLLSLLPLLLVGLALTFSRGGYLSLVAAVSFVWYRMARQHRIGLFIGFLATMVLLTVFLPETFRQRAGSILPAVEERSDTFGTRVNLWEIGLKIIRDNPVRGVGLGNFPIASGRYAHGLFLVSRLVAHSAYIGIAAETGLVGLALFLLMHFQVLRSCGLAVRRKDEGMSELYFQAVAVEACIIAMIVGNISLSGEGGKSLWFFFGLAVALGHRAVQERRLEASPAMRAVHADGSV